MYDDIIYKYRIYYILQIEKLYNININNYIFICMKLVFIYIYIYIYIVFSTAINIIVNITYNHIYT